MGMSSNQVTSAGNMHSIDNIQSAKLAGSIQKGSGKHASTSASNTNLTPNGNLQKFSNLNSQSSKMTA
jgi:hypothetical protein|tara:strand:+ start:2707 stop:2910 length:204 start_codon:yes stop_codon:yes gene_type:complete